MPNLNAGIISQIESNSSGSQSVPWPKLLMKRNIALSTSVAAIATSGNTKKKYRLFLFTYFNRRKNRLNSKLGKAYDCQNIEHDAQSFAIDKWPFSDHF